MEGPFDKVPAAVLVNANNTGYCRVVLDDTSIKFFLNNLSNIENMGTDAICGGFYLTKCYY